MDLKLKSNWQQLMEQYCKSGLTKTEFCRSQKIPSHTFFYYQKLHQTGPVGLTKPSQLFVPIVEKRSFTVRINDGLNLSFDVIPDPAWMASFIRSLGDLHASA